MTRIMEALAARMDRIRKGEKTEGFTLIELLVVVIIIGILAAIAIPVYISVQNNAKDSAVKSDLGNLKTAEVAQYTSNGAYDTGTSTGQSFTLSSNGYTQSDVKNYKNASSTPKFYASATAGSFCVAAISASGDSYAVSDLQAIAKGSCTTGGAYSSTAVTALP